MNSPDSVLKSYIEYTPLALAFERAVEAKIYSELIFKRPILDIGCGEGLFAKLSFPEKIDTGIDPNNRELNRARQLGGYAELIQCKGDKIPKPSESYNTIFSNSVLEHIPDVQPVFAEAFRLLSSDGYFYLTVPTNQFDKFNLIYQILHFINFNNLAQKYSLFFNRFWRHYHFYDKEGWIQIATNAGFVVDKAHTYNSKKYCLTNDILAPFGILGMVTKKIFNKWTLFPMIRRIVYYPVYILSRHFLKGAEMSQDGGLLFLSLKKPAK